MGNKINQSIENVLNKNIMLTSDLGGSATVNQLQIVSYRR